MGQGQGACPTMLPNHGILRTQSSDEFDAEDDCAVYLNIYDLNEEYLLANDIFQEVLELGGAFHAGVEVYGREWSFGTTGVGFNRPKTHDVHVYRQSILIGYSQYDPDQVETIIEDVMNHRWPGSSYQLLSRNCCTFSRAFCKHLTGNVIPDWVDRLPRLLNVITKPVKGVANVAAGMGKSVNSAPASHSFAPRRDCSIESVDSNFSIASLATTLSAIDSTPKNESLIIPNGVVRYPGPSFGFAY